MRFVASIDGLQEILEWIRAQAKICGLNDKLIVKLELVCEEAIVNVISYAYFRGPFQAQSSIQDMIDITCVKKNQRFEITICDWGKPFNPIDSEINPQLDIPVEKRKIGGLGIFLIRKAINEMSYQRVDDMNILRLSFDI